MGHGTGFGKHGCGHQRIHILWCPHGWVGLLLLMNCLCLHGFAFLGPSSPKWKGEDQQGRCQTAEYLNDCKHIEHNWNPFSCLAQNGLLTLCLPVQKSLGVTHSCDSWHPSSLLEVLLYIAELLACLTLVSHDSYSRTHHDELFFHDGYRHSCLRG